MSSVSGIEEDDKDDKLDKFIRSLMVKIMNLDLKSSLKTIEKIYNYFPKNESVPLMIIDEIIKNEKKNKEFCYLIKIKLLELIIDDLKHLKSCSFN